MQKKLLSNLLKRNPKSIIVASLGTISYDLKGLKHPSIIFVPGAMGCVMGIGLGIALNTKKKVVIIIGDGSYLMKMGSISTILKHKPKNLQVHVLVNNQYASTGGQKINFNKSLVPKQFHIHEA
jgi:phosphonopyruvate decarboxylase